jgi:hypothetical protein
LPQAIACDDQHDIVYVVVPGSSGFGGSIIGYPRSLGLDGTPVKTWLIASSVQLGSTLRAAVNPTDGRLWIASKANGTARAFKLPPVPRGPVSPVESIGGFTSLTGIDFDDSGRIYAVDGGAVEVFERDTAGAWLPGDASAFAGIDVGTMLRVAKSRSNFTVGLHDTPDWNNIDAPELEQLGTSVPDCLGDLNGDSVVGAADLAILLGGWNGAGIADLDASGVVDAADLSLLLGAWGDC